MANRVTIHIHNQNYHILAEEGEAYIQQCAELVRKELDEAMNGTTLSISDGAVLACLNLADKLTKERQVSDNLRGQLKQALDENNHLKRGGRKNKKAPAPEAKTEAPEAEPDKTELEKAELDGAKSDLSEADSAASQAASASPADTADTDTAPEDAL